ncbi:mechanosensitive ion channel family protein [Elusimicrobiota bacterium]
MFTSIIDKIILGNSVYDYGIFILCIFLGIAAAKLIEKIALKRLILLVSKTKNVIDDHLIGALKKELFPLSYILIVFLSLGLLEIAPGLYSIIKTVFMISVTIYGIRFLLSVTVFSIESYFVRKEQDPSKAGALKGILTVLKFIVWSTALIVLLDNIGIKISTLVAGLGIGGVAIALAAQAVLGDLFSYITIFFDRPFEIGDFIIIGDYLGTVEYIGIKTTRIRSLGGEQLIFSNTDLTNSRLRNYKRMEKRRVVFHLGVTYETSHEKLQLLPDLIKDIIINIEDTVFDRAHFQQFADFNLLFEIVYYVIGSDYNKYMDIQQEINLKIVSEFEQRNIEFAYPTQKLYLVNDNMK